MVSTQSPRQAQKRKAATTTTTMTTMLHRDAAADPTLYLLHSAAVLGLASGTNHTTSSLPLLSADQAAAFLRRVAQESFAPSSSSSSTASSHTAGYLRNVHGRIRSSLWSAAASTSPDAAPRNTLAEAVECLPVHWRLHHPICTRCASLQVPGLTASSSTRRQRRHQAAAAAMQCLFCLGDVAARGSRQRRRGLKSKAETALCMSLAEQDTQQRSKSRFESVRQRKRERCGRAGVVTTTSSHRPAPEPDELLKIGGSKKEKMPTSTPPARGGPFSANDAERRDPQTQVMPTAPKKAEQLEGATPPSQIQPQPRPPPTLTPTPTPTTAATSASRRSHESQEVRETGSTVNKKAKDSAAATNYTSGSAGRASGGSHKDALRAMLAQQKGARGDKKGRGGDGIAIEGAKKGGGGTNADGSAQSGGTGASAGGGGGGLRDFLAGL